MGALQAEFPGSHFFSADAEVSRLLKEDPDVQRALGALQSQWGESVILQGSVDKTRLRARIFSDPAARRQLEALLHPRVRAVWEPKALAAQKNRDWMFAEIPLLYETSSEGLCHRVVVTACSSETQRRRLVEYRGLPGSLLEQICAAQMSLSEKCTRADHLIWNDFSILCLHRQTRSLANWLRHHYRADRP
jgi:dephospho-CoA kinase